MFVFIVTGLFFLALLLSLVAQVYVTYTFDKWGVLDNEAKLTGNRVAEHIIQQAGLTAQLESSSGLSGDHYDPRSHTVHLTEKIANKPSIAAMAVAAHELGHAQQHEVDSQMIQLRNFLVPAVQVGPSISYALVTAGLFFHMFRLVWLGVIAFGSVVVFMFLTLPIEVDASRRGMLLLRESGLMTNTSDEKGVQQVLTAAALTYIAASILSLSQLLRYISLARR
jgi:uncharacterized protein